MVFKSKIALTGLAILYIGCMAQKNLNDSDGETSAARRPARPATHSRMVLADGQSCGGGIAGGLSCAEGLECVLPLGANPNVPGTCHKVRADDLGPGENESCGGGIAGALSCKPGLVCQKEANAHPNVPGKCVPLVFGGAQLGESCGGGFASRLCAPGLDCVKEAGANPNVPGTCQKPATRSHTNAASKGLDKGQSCGGGVSGLGCRAGLECVKDSNASSPNVPGTCQEVFSGKANEGESCGGGITGMMCRADLTCFKEEGTHPNVPGQCVHMIPSGADLGDSCGGGFTGRLCKPGLICIKDANAHPNVPGTCAQEER